MMGPALVNAGSNPLRPAAVLAVAALVLLSCSREQPPQSAKPAPPSPEGSAAPTATASAPLRDFSVENLSRGAALYGEHCLQCHGPDAQGHPDWQTPSNGSFTAAPPLNGTGNDWKRTRSQLLAVIKKGASRDGYPAMPAYDERLDDRDIESIIAWFQTLWPPEVYQRWLKANAAPPVPQG